MLYEHAAGFALFSVKEFEEIGMFLPQVESSVTDYGKFNSLVKLAGFAPFKTAIAALENINAISEGIVPQDLMVFLDDFFSKLKKKKCTLGIADAKLGAAITEAIGVQCSQTGVVPEIIRGVRFHFHKLVKGNLKLFYKPKCKTSSMRLSLVKCYLVVVLIFLYAFSFGIIIKNKLIEEYCKIEQF